MMDTNLFILLIGLCVFDLVAVCVWMVRCTKDRLRDERIDDLFELAKLNGYTLHHAFDYAVNWWEKKGKGAK